MADKLDGVAITANSVPSNRIQTGSITSTQLQTSLYNTIVNATHPKIRSLTYPGDDTAANTGGSQTVIINGTGFGTNVAVYINGNSVPSVTVSNANSVSFSTPALSAATYPLYLINTDDGATAILIPGIQYSGTPAWVTTSPLADQQAAAAWSISLSATGDSPIVYSLQAGSTLPAGITLAANGLISGTMSSPPATDTTYNFTVVAIDPQNQDASKAFSVSVTVTIDTQFNYNVLLLHADGTNNGNNHAFLDSSNNNFAITRNGNASQGTFSPFSPTGWSGYFASSSSDYISAASNAAFALGSGDFTLEAFVFAATSQTDNWIIGLANNCWLRIGSGGVLEFYNNITTTSIIATGVVLPLNQWIHVAAVRVGTTLTLYQNGVSIASGTVSTNFSTSVACTIGNQVGFDRRWNGYISNARVVKGTAVYTAAFTPPTSALTAIANTSLLACQSNRFIDNSNNAFALTVNGTPSVQAFSPFASTTAYSTSSHGGSAYFDGNSDSLTLTSTSSLQLTGVFTIEFWMYLNTIVLDTQHPSVITFPGGWQVYVNSSNLYVALYNGTADVLASASSSITTNQWYHIAISRNASNNLSLYVNGTRVATTTNSGTIGSSSGTLRFMSFDGTGGDANGYISNLRFVNGTAVYDPTLTTLTVPTAPLSAVANTQLLLSCTNAQIFDSTAKNVLETVSGAKVNTSIYKYGTGSVAFNGTSDYLSIPYTQNQNFGTGDFTVEGWFYLNSLSASYYVLGGTWSSATSDEWLIQIQNNGSLRFLTTADTNFYATGIITTGKWYHFAASRNSGTIKTYINGTAISTVTNANTIGSVSKTMFIGQQSGGNWYWNGYVDDFRISKGLGRYPYNFTPPTKAFADKGGADTSTSDTYFPYTTLLLPGNGTNNANNQAFVDSSTNNFAITRNGNATQGTFSPFSQTGWSGYFDGTANGFITVTDAGSVLDLTGDFTLEFWTYQIAIATLNATVNLFLSVDTLDRFQLYQDASNVAFSIGGAVLISSSTRASLNSWNHYAITRSGSTTTLFLNGNSIGSASNNYSMSCASLTIGGQNRSGTANPSSVYHGCNAYISNFRIIKGNALYTSNFTPSSSALTAVSNTSLLTLQSNRFIDTSNNALAITIGSTPSIQAFSPFSPSAVYAAANNGGSVYFDGTGDYLSLPDNANLEFGNSNFTMEFWVKTTSSTQYDALVSKEYAAAAGSWSLLMNNSGATAGDIAFWSYDYNAYAAYMMQTTGASIRDDAWHHIALVRNGSSWAIYIDGISRATQTSSMTVGDYAGGIWIGNDPQYNTRDYPGYISDFRIVKGNAVYTTNFTPPTAPLTAISNTQLLLSATNGGIIDATGKNVLETVGDTKISTTQSKFGGASIFFDGTGDYITIPANQNMTFGTGDFTMEMWVYSGSNGTTTRMAGNIAGGAWGANKWVLGTTEANNPNKFFMAVNNYSSASAMLTSTTTSNDSAWHHFAVTRYGNVWRLFVDGIQQATVTSSVSLDGGVAASVSFGWSNNSADGQWAGYIDDLRITKGIARYTSNFTPPASALLAK